jgi:hypothetical protein
MLYAFKSSDRRMRGCFRETDLSAEAAEGTAGAWVPCADEFAKRAFGS